MNMYKPSRFITRKHFGGVLVTLLLLSLVLDNSQVVLAEDSTYKSYSEVTYFESTTQPPQMLSITSTVNTSSTNLDPASTTSSIVNPGSTTTTLISSSWNVSIWKRTAFKIRGGGFERYHIDENGVEYWRFDGECYFYKPSRDQGWRIETNPTKRAACNEYFELNHSAGYSVPPSTIPTQSLPTSSVPTSDSTHVSLLPISTTSTSISLTPSSWTVPVSDVSCDPLSDPSCQRHFYDGTATRVTSDGTRYAMSHLLVRDIHNTANIWISCNVQYVILDDSFEGFPKESDILGVLELDPSDRDTSLCDEYRLPPTTTTQPAGDPAYCDFLSNPNCRYSNGGNGINADGVRFRVVTLLLWDPDLNEWSSCAVQYRKQIGHDGIGEVLDMEPRQKDLGRCANYKRWSPHTRSSSTTMSIASECIREPGFEFRGCIATTDDVENIIQIPKSQDRELDINGTVGASLNNGEWNCHQRYLYNDGSLGWYASDETYYPLRVYCEGWLVGSGRYNNTLPFSTPDPPYTTPITYTTSNMHSNNIDPISSHSIVTVMNTSISPTGVCDFRTNENCFRYRGNRITKTPDQRYAYITWVLEWDPYAEEWLSCNVQYRAREHARMTEGLVVMEPTPEDLSVCDAIRSWPPIISMHGGVPTGVNPAPPPITAPKEIAERIIPIPQSNRIGTMWQLGYTVVDNELRCYILDWAFDKRYWVHYKSASPISEYCEGWLMGMGYVSKPEPSSTITPITTLYKSTPMPIPTSYQTPVITTTSTINTISPTTTITPTIQQPTPLSHSDTSTTTTSTTYDTTLQTTSSTSTSSSTTSTTPATSSTTTTTHPTTVPPTTIQEVLLASGNRESNHTPSIKTVLEPYSAKASSSSSLLSFHIRSSSVAPSSSSTTISVVSTSISTTTSTVFAPDFVVDTTLFIAKPITQILHPSSTTTVEEESLPVSSEARKQTVSSTEMSTSFMPETSTSVSVLPDPTKTLIVVPPAKKVVSPAEKPVLEVTSESLSTAQHQHGTTTLVQMYGGSSSEVRDAGVWNPNISTDNVLSSSTSQNSPTSIQPVEGSVGLVPSEEELSNSVEQLASEFTDHLDTPHRKNIEQLEHLGITQGCDPPYNRRFCPDRTVTRGEMATLLARTLDLPPVSTDYFVDDIANTHQESINRLAAAGLTMGCNPPENNRFCPDRFISRGEMATLLFRSLGLPDSSRSGLYIDTIAHSLSSPIAAVTQAGITQGCNPPANTRFCPDRPLTRAESATFLIRATELLSTQR